MIVYDDLSEEIKTICTKEQIEKFAKSIRDIWNALWKIYNTIRPALLKAAKVLEQKLNEENRTSKLNKIVPNSKYLPYKPKIKQIKIHRKIIYYRIRSNC